MENVQKKEQECCPPFDPDPWQDQIIEWDNKKFIKEKVSTFLFMPLNFGPKIRKADSLLRKEGGSFIENLCLSDHTSKWNMDIYMAVDREINGVENVTLSGKYFCRVYEGSFSNTGKWCKNFEDVAKGRGLKIRKWYMWYTTCPKCAKKYGKNYVVILGQTS